MKPEDWAGEILVSTTRPKGFRLEIEPNPPGASSSCRSGGDPVGQAVCPNCKQQLFPVFKLNFEHPDLRSLQLWEASAIDLLVCPACALYMQPYWLLFRGDGVLIEGGERDGEKLQEIEAPYQERAVRLVPLDVADYPSSPAAVDSYRRRTKPPGVYHQVGGVPFRRGFDSLDCFSCRAAMAFAGVIDNDDLNVPLYEPVHRPVGLIIGDGDRLHWFTCQGCRVIGVKWIR